MTIDTRYTALHSSYPATRRTPVVGITGNYGDKGCELAEGYYESIIRAGATPVVLPPTDNADVLATQLQHIDALLLSGGGDINPLLLGQEPSPALHSINARRDMCELLLTRMAADRQMPILGICRGCQVIAAALGGKVYQDIATEHATTAAHTLIKHSQDLDRSCASHSVAISEGSLLHGIFGTTVLAVNSFHHQAVSHAGEHLSIVATAADGVAEAIESAEGKSIIGVQWHPETFCLAADDSMAPLFRWLTAEAALYSKARGVHSRIVSIDTHCDTPMWFDHDIHFDHREASILVDLHKMEAGCLDASVMVAYIPQGPLTPEGYAAAAALAESRLQGVRRLAEHHSHAVGIARTAADIRRLKAEGRRAIVLGIENGYAIGRDIGRIAAYARQGLAYITLCHNGNNDICGSARPREGEPETGLTDYGRDVVRELNRTGILADLSHASRQTFADTLELSRVPVVCSHSSAYALCPHPRNLTDEQLRALARQGGVASVTFYHGFLRQDGLATINDAIAHLLHMVSVAGIEHVGIGTDFDGDGGVPGLASASELINITRELLRRHFTEAQLSMLWSGNFLRVLQAAQDAATV